MTAGLLAAAVALAWLGALGFVRLHGTLDRLHCVGFVNATSGLVLVLAALAADGPSVRVGKAALLAVAALVIGAATAHVIGRMLVLRQGRP